MNPILTWLQGRLSEASTYAGLFTVASSLGLHFAIPANLEVTIATTVATIVGAALTAASTHDWKPVVADAVQAIPVAVETSTDLATAHAALAGGEVDLHNKIMGNIANSVG